jgi:hypothetical protein
VKELYDIFDEVNSLLFNNEMEFDLPTVQFHLDIAKTLYYADDAKSLLLLKAALENLIEINERSKKLD